MKDQQLKKIWGIPALLAAVTLFGLLSALLGTGLLYPLSWAAMLIPPVIIVWKIGGAKKLSKR